jgi:hypothetical protein
MQHLFLDESGNHSLHAFEPGYPVFVLGGVIVKDDDLEALEEAVRAFKVTAFDDPQIVLHTADIVRNRHGFERMADPVERRRVFALLNDLVASLPVSIVACAVRKDALLRRYGRLAVDPYMLSLGVVVERFCFATSGETGGGAIVAEKRGGRLDTELRLAWDLLRLNGTRYVRPQTIARRITSFELRSKAEAVPGLEIADLVMSPLGRWVAGRPPRHDLDVVRSKLRRGPDGRWEGAGLVVLPKEDGRGPLRSTQPLQE